VNQRISPLDDGVLGPDPIRQFEDWYRIAVDAGLKQPDAMTLATATKEGMPSARTVLLKEVTHRGFVFYSNYRSRKGKELAENPFAALVLHWVELDRAVRVEGPVTMLTAEESDAYFSSRPREGQLSSLASHQGEVVPDRRTVDFRFDEVAKKYEGKNIPRPRHWGGYRLSPERIEFWQHRFARMNDRILYTRKAGDRWLIQRISP